MAFMPKNYSNKLLIQCDISQNSNSTLEITLTTLIYYKVIIIIINIV